MNPLAILLAISIVVNIALLTWNARVEGYNLKMGREIDACSRITHQAQVRLEKTLSEPCPKCGWAAS